MTGLEDAKLKIENFRKEMEQVKRNDEEEFLKLVIGVLMDCLGCVSSASEFNYNDKWLCISYKIHNAIVYLCKYIDRDEYNINKNDLDLLLQSVRLSKKSTKVLYKRIRKIAGRIDINEVSDEITDLLMTLAYVLVNISNRIAKEKEIGVKLNCADGYFIPMMPSCNEFDFISANESMKKMIKEKK